MSWYGSRPPWVRPCVRPLTFYRLRDKVHIFEPILAKLAQSVCIIVSKMKKIRQSVHPCVCLLTFSRLLDKVHIFDPILLKLAQSACIIVRINPIEDEENLSVQCVCLSVCYFFSLSVLRVKRKTK